MLLLHRIYNMQLFAITNVIQNTLDFYRQRYPENSASRLVALKRSSLNVYDIIND